MSRHTEYIPHVADWQTLKHHPLSALVEFGAGIDLDALAADMRENGYDEDKPIVLLDGEILDGRHRHAAAIMAEVEPVFRKFTGKDPVAYAMEKLRRQHLNDSQRAMLAAGLAKLPRGRPELKAQSCAFHSQDEAADMLKVSRRLVQQARTVQDQGSAKLKAAVNEGTVSVSDAAKIVSKPAPVQNRAVKDVKAGKASTVTASANAQDRKLCASCLRAVRVGQPLPPTCPECNPTKPARCADPKACGKCDCCLAWKAKASAGARFIKPTVEEVAAYCAERNNHVDAQSFCDFYDSKGWVVGKVPMKDWKAAVRTWEKNSYSKNGKHKDDFYDGLKEFVARGEKE